MLASFLVVRDGDALRLVMRSSVAASFVKRLSMFVLRSKVKISLEAEQIALLGLLGSQRAAVLAAAGIDPLPETYKGMRGNGGEVWVSLPGERTLGIINTDQAAKLTDAIGPQALPVDESCWEWFDVEQGIVFIDQATQDELTPQMANLELIGGVSFSKGCYPGQEVVARTQHLGKVKRRAYRAHVEGDVELRAGDPLFAPSHGEQSIGTILTVAPAPDGGFDLLVSVLSAAVQAGGVAIGDLSGARVSFAPLPYALPD